jgi:poly(3-hydroxybutyrate) depolymerase
MKLLFKNDSSLTLSLLSTVPGTQQGNVESDVADAPCWSLPGGLQIGEDEGETTSCCCQKDDEAVVVHGDDETTDLDFLHQMAFYLVRDVPTLSDSKVSIDTRRIYMSGHANGCMLAHAMAARHSDLVAAVACMAGAAITAFPLSYEPVPTWTIAGALDEIIPIGGSRLPSGSIQFPGQQAGFQLLADSHACSNVYSNSTEVHDMNLPDYPLAGTLHVQTAFGCINGAVVQHLTLVTAGHLLYKGVSEVFPSNAADTSVDTTGMAWGFMTSFMSGREPALQQAIDLDEIKDLLENEEEEIREEELLHHDRPSTSHSDEGDAMENVDTSQDRDGNDIEQPVETTSEAVDEVASTWQGLRGISESEALSS